MTLANSVKVSRRFQRSIRIDNDLGERNAIDGFICPQSSREILESMARQISETEQGAFTWTGPYGSGKSSLVVALAALLNGKAELKQQAAKTFGHRVAKILQTTFPIGSKGCRVLPIVGRRDDPVKVIGESLIEKGFVTRQPCGGWTEDRLVTTLLKVAKTKFQTHGGLVVFVDEMGKFLEAAAHELADIYFFQQLAEAASRSNGKLILVCVLHQAIEEYAHWLTRDLRDEWIKIQGRFIDLPVNMLGEEQIDLISRAIESDHIGKNSNNWSITVARLARRNRESSLYSLAKTLDKCWPLHPIVACLLGPISRRRFGQNQRSIFGFLNSSEPHGFQDFLRSAKPGEIYSPVKLWNYLRTNLEPSIFASPDGHRWALATEVIDRSETIEAETFHVNLLKTIAVIDLFKQRSGLVPNIEILKTCFPDQTEKSLTQGLTQLSRWSFTIYKKFQDAYAIFAGSDFDIDDAVGEALDEIKEIDLLVLETWGVLQRILAKRHYHETGAMRWVDFKITSSRNVVELASRFTPQSEIIGQFILVIPTERENKKLVQNACRDAARSSIHSNNVVGYSEHSWKIVTFLRERLAFSKVSNDYVELAGDSVARREISARIADLHTQLESELSKSIDSALWYRKQHSPRTYRRVELNNLASELADKSFNQCPKLNNELLNRTKPSSSAIAAQNALLRRMINNEGETRLGINGYPAEGGLYASILEATGLYAETGDGWRFITPPNSESDLCRMLPTWKAAVDYLKNNNQLVSISEIHENVWTQPPLGIKKGLMPLLSLAFILSQSDNLAIYREGIFRSNFDEIDVEYMAKDAKTIQLRWMDLDEFSRNLLLELAVVVRDLDKNSELEHLEPINIARGLVAVYEQLPQWTKRTMKLSAKAMKVREIFKRAHDPNQFLFNDIFTLLGSEDIYSSNLEEIKRIAFVVKEGLQELVQAYHSLLYRLRDIMLAELGVRDLTEPSLSELRKRAANVKGLTGDFRLEAFIGRLMQYDGSNAKFEGIVSLAANKPLRKWTDPDVNRASIEIVDMAQNFLRAETFTRIKGRPEKRVAIAVVVGMEGQRTPIHEEFDVIDTDRSAIGSLVERISETLETSDASDRNVVLAALAEVSAKYIQSSAKMEQDGEILMGENNVST